MKPNKFIVLSNDRNFRLGKLRQSSFRMNRVLDLKIHFIPATNLTLTLSRSERASEISTWKLLSVLRSTTSSVRFWKTTIFTKIPFLGSFHHPLKMILPGPTSGVITVRESNSGGSDSRSIAVGVVDGVYCCCGCLEGVGIGSGSWPFKSSGWNSSSFVVFPFTPFKCASSEEASIFRRF